MSDFNTTLQEMLEGLQSFKADAKADLSNLRAMLDATRAEMLAPGRSAGRASGGGGSGIPNYRTPGERFIKEADLELLRKTNRLTFKLENLHPSFSTKTLIDSTALGFSTPGILGEDRLEPSIVPLARRRLTVRDLLRSKPITQGQVGWITEASASYGASPVEEGYAKVESENTFLVKSEKVRTIAHWIPISKTALDDLPELRRFIDESLIYGLKVIEEYELLFGDGTGEHLHGLAHQATAYAATYAAAGDTMIDKLRKIALELEVADERCSAYVLNPVDWANVQLVKTEPGGANTGRYICSDPLGGQLLVPTVWAAAVVVTRAMPQGSFLAGDFSKAIIGDRQPATLDLAETHSDYFVRNKLALRCESRISLGCLRTGAFRFGTF
jgi:HK97 family phage major capsid protein